MVEQPQREQRLDEKATPKRVETEQRGQGQYDPPRRAERTARRLAYRCLCRRFQLTINDKRNSAEEGVYEEHTLQCTVRRYLNGPRDNLGSAREQAPDSTKH